MPSLSKINHGRSPESDKSYHEKLEKFHSGLLDSELFKRNLDWGKNRPGHPESTLRNHLQILHENLNSLLGNSSFGTKLGRILTPLQIRTIRALIDVHDIMKPSARTGVLSEGRQSHAALASKLVTELGGPKELALMTKLHDVGHALYRGYKRKAAIDRPRLQKLLFSIKDWDTFLTFQLCDKLCPGRDTKSIEWLVEQLRKTEGKEFTIPVDEMIQFLKEKHQLFPPEEGTISVNLRELSSLTELNEINSFQSFKIWLQQFAKSFDRESRPPRYRKLKRLASDPEKKLQAIFNFAGVTQAEENDYKNLAAKVREAVWRN